MSWQLGEPTPPHSHTNSAAWTGAFRNDVVLVDEHPAPVLPAPASSDRPRSPTPDDPDVIVLDTPPQPSAGREPRETIFIDDSPRKRRRRDTPPPQSLVPATREQDNSHVIVVDDDDVEVEPRQNQQNILPHPRDLLDEVLDAPPSIPIRHRVASSSTPLRSPPRRLSDSSDDIIETSAAGPRLATIPPSVRRLYMHNPIRGDLFDVESFQEPLELDSPEPLASSLPSLHPSNRRSMPVPPPATLAASASNAAPRPAAATRSSARNVPLPPMLSPSEIDIPDVIVPSRVARASSAGAGPSSAAASDRTFREARAALRREQQRIDEMSRQFSGYLTDLNDVHLLHEPDGATIATPDDRRERHSQPHPNVTASRSRRMNPALRPSRPRLHPVPRSSVRRSGLHGLRLASNSQSTFDTSPPADQVNAGESGGRVLTGSSGGRLRLDEGGDLFDPGMYLHTRHPLSASLRRGVGRTSTAQTAASLTMAGFSARPMHHTMRTSSSRGRRAMGEPPTIHGSGNRRRSNSAYLTDPPAYLSGILAFVRSPFDMHPERLDYEHLIRLDEQLMRDKNRAEKSQIESLPVAKAKIEDKEIRCCVCMCDVEEGEELRVLPCSHKYHRNCIDEWLTYNGCCPVDKKRISPPRSRRRCSNHRD